MSVFPGYIRVNLPLNHSSFVTGNGEGVWVKVESDIEKLYNEDYSGGIFKGILGNDSLYYPCLKCGDTVIFTMRGENRPVCLYEGFLDNLNGISEDEKEVLIKNLYELNSVTN